MAKIGVLLGKLYVGGVEKIAIEEALGLQKLGNEVSLLVLSKTDQPTGAFGDSLNQVKIIYLDQRLPRFLRVNFKIPFFNFFSFFHLTSAILMPFKVKKGEYDLIISHNAYNTFTAYTLSRFKRIPYAIYVHDPIYYILKKVYKSGAIKMASSILLPIAKWTDKRLARRAIAVFTGSKIHATYLQSLVGDATKIKQLIPGYSARQKLSGTPKDYLLTITAWKRGKQLEELLPIIGDLSGARLKIAGKWIHEDYRQQIEGEIARLGLGDRAVILGEVSESHLADLYAGAIANLILNDEIGFGMPGIEAAGNGTTFVAPNDCGVSELFEDNKEAIYFPGGNFASAKEKIVRLYSNPAMAKSLGERAWVRCRDEYSWQRHAEEILACV